MSKSTQFFATGGDLHDLLGVIEGEMPLQFVQAGRFDAAQQPLFFKSSDIPDLGVASSESSVSCRRFLVSERGTIIKARELSSTPHFAFDQLVNPKTVTFNPGGLWNNHILLMGIVGTASDDPDALRLMKTFRAAFKKAFTTIRRIHVGTEAKGLLIQGKRLTAAEQSPIEFDLAP
jgi:hypothetical protein